MLVLRRPKLWRCGQGAPGERRVGRQARRSHSDRSSDVSRGRRVGQLTVRISPQSASLSASGSASIRRDSSVVARRGEEERACGVAGRKAGVSHLGGLRVEEQIVFRQVREASQLSRFHPPSAASWHLANSWSIMVLSMYHLCEERWRLDEWVAAQVQYPEAVKAADRGEELLGSNKKSGCEYRWCPSIRLNCLGAASSITRAAHISANYIIPTLTCAATSVRLVDLRTRASTGRGAAKDAASAVIGSFESGQWERSRERRRGKAGARARLGRRREGELMSIVSKRRRSSCRKGEKRGGGTWTITKSNTGTDSYSRILGSPRWPLISLRYVGVPEPMSYRRPLARYSTHMYSWGLTLYSLAQADSLMRSRGPRPGAICASNMPFTSSSSVRPRGIGRLRFTTPSVASMPAMSLVNPQCGQHIQSKPAPPTVS
jgi:hypothetical protein